MTSRRNRRGLRGLLVVMLAALASSLQACSDPPPTAESNPPFDRVVLVTLDTLRADHLSPLGYPRDTAPFFSELARRGSLFRNGMSASSITAPSHSTILTGLYPYQHGVLENGHTLAGDRPSWVTGLSDEGFATGAFLSVGFLKLVDPGFDHVEAAARSGDETIDAALRWVEKQGDAPLFLWVHLFDLHEWILFDTPSEYLERVRTPEAMHEGLADRIDALHLGTASNPSQSTHVAASREAVDHYDARIRMIDEQLERLHREIERSGGRTLWIVTSDHGEGMWSHQIVAHARHLYEEQLRAPLLLYASDGSLEGPAVETLVHHVDLHPTLVELLGLPPSPAPGAPGARSLVPLLPIAREGQAGPTQVDSAGDDRILLAQRQPPRPRWIDENVYVLRQGPLKYIRRSRSGDELYDLGNDPDERRNLIDAPPPAAAGLIRRAGEMDRLLEDAAAAPAVPESLHEELRALGYVE